MANKKEYEESGIKCLYFGSHENKIGNLALKNRLRSPSSNAMKRHLTNHWGNFKVRFAENGAEISARKM